MTAAIEFEANRHVMNAFHREHDPTQANGPTCAYSSSVIHSDSCGCNHNLSVSDFVL
jgi:hypothetical protein